MGTTYTESIHAHLTDALTETSTLLGEYVSGKGHLTVIQATTLDLIAGRLRLSIRELEEAFPPEREIYPAYVTNPEPGDDDFEAW